MFLKPEGNHVSGRPDTMMCPSPNSESFSAQLCESCKCQENPRPAQSEFCAWQFSFVIWVNVPFSSGSWATDVSFLSSCQSSMGTYRVTTESGPDQFRLGAWILFPTKQHHFYSERGDGVLLHTFVFPTPSRKHHESCQEEREKKRSWAFCRVVVRREGCLSPCGPRSLIFTVNMQGLDLNKGERG